MSDLSLVFAELAGGQEVWKNALEDWNLIESPFLRDIRATGRTEGRTEHAREAVLRVLDRRFPGLLSASVRARIQAEADLAKLDDWLVEAAVASLEAFQAQFN